MEFIHVCNENVPKIASDVLRRMAKTFVDEEDVVKLQILNLAVELILSNHWQNNYTFDAKMRVKSFTPRNPNHCLNMRAKGYTDLPPFPAEPPETENVTSKAARRTQNTSTEAKP